MYCCSTCSLHPLLTLTLTSQCCCFFYFPAAVSDWVFDSGIRWRTLFVHCPCLFPSATAMSPLNFLPNKSITKWFLLKQLVHKDCFTRGMINTLHWAIVSKDEQIRSPWAAVLRATYCITIKEPLKSRMICLDDESEAFIMLFSGQSSNGKSVFFL